MVVRRVALIYDDTVRHDTTGSYCRRAMDELAEVRHFLPDEVSRIPRNGFDLYLNIDDGLRYRFPRDLHPSAFWAIDTHLNIDWYRTKASDFDWVFVAQRDGSQQLRSSGINTAQWLPLACDPEIHRKYDMIKRYDVCFIGNQIPGARAKAIQQLTEHFPNLLIDQCYFDQMAKAYSTTRIVFNRSVRNDLNMRVFEALACGSLLVTNDLSDNGQAEWFRDGEHLVTYANLDEMVQRIAYYLHHDSDRERIAESGRKAVLENHTYRHRMEHILDNIEPRGNRIVTTLKTEPPEHRIDESYYEYARPELMNTIPTSARRILDIGCAAGRLGKALKKRRNVHVVGIERNREVAETARTHLDQVIIGDVETIELPCEEDPFDCIVCGDILEHLQNPRALLRRARQRLSSDGTLIASIPNVRHHSVLRGLLDGNWTYQSAGVLDETHLRFFTRREMEKLFYRSGYRIQQIRPLSNPGHSKWKRQGRSGELQFGPLQIQRVPTEMAEDFHVVQYLIEAKPREIPNRGLTSIVMLTLNQLEHTKRCIESVLRYTDEPIEWVFVDNASTDATVDFLRTIPNATLIVNDVNRGFPAGVNQGVRAASGENILLLNNDIVVTTGWLDRLLDALHSAPEVGLVGPCSNRVSGPQQVPVDYETLDGLDGFAWQHATANRGHYLSTERLVGFCLLFRSDLIDRVGLFDEQFGIGCYEDDDFCRRAALTGYQALVVFDAFVHHVGNRTFHGTGANLKKILKQNKRRFKRKWQGFRPESETNAPTISLCMICRDNANTIQASLDSIRPWVDEMIVVDTGSKDETPQRVVECNAQLHHFPWCDDFAAARNESIRHATCDWIFWMDSDDTIDDSNGRKLREIVSKTLDPNILGHVIQVHCPGIEENDKTEITVVDHVKLFLNRANLQFEGRIHEQVLPTIRRAGGDVAFTDVFVVHSGADHTPEGRRRKLQRDFRLLEMDLSDRPDHPFVLFNLGMTHADANEHEKAVDALKQSIQVSQPNESHLRKAYALLIGCYSQLERYDEAWKTCIEGRANYPDDVELLFREGVLHQHFNRLTEAEQSYLQVFDQRTPRHFASVDRGIHGFKTRHNLALVYEALGDLPRAEAQWRQVVAEEPTYRTGWRALGNVILQRGDIDASELIAQQLLQHTTSETCRIEANLLLGRVAEKRNDYVRADQLYQQAADQWPDDLETLHVLCQFLFQHGDPIKAEAALAELVRRYPDDEAARRNLRSIRCRIEEGT